MLIQKCPHHGFPEWMLLGQLNDSHTVRLLLRLNRIESASTPSMHRGDKLLFHYINNLSKDVNYVRNRGRNLYSNTYNPG
ncbi:hypothetical protein EPI10_029326 [Gossypium australe]|uniref:Uncharacterized protein n=1 Tax=Gossypium australe TaxID=47621 RepID=A0A5B6V1A4_9ROSI|nr:hypothetical protein EPI10_029326 [Gossypium australe]